MPTRSEELEQFKTQINLCEYAAAQGYVLMPKKSYGSSAVMKSGSDTIVIGKSASNGHWIYWQVDSGVGSPGADSGSIVDFVQNRIGGSLGDVRKELRPWINQSSVIERPDPNTFVSDLKPVTKDRMRMLAQYEATKIVSSQRYLEDKRCISPEILAHSRFAGRIRQDQRGNAIFPHYNQEGICGFEMKNAGFTAFSTGGEKGLWCSRVGEGDTELVITETAIDALSYFALHGGDSARYISIGGAMNRNQPKLIKSAIQKMPSGSRIVAALDNDPGGSVLFERIQAILAAQEAPECVLVDQRPPTTGQDWNDVLRASMAKSRQSSDLRLEF